MKHKAIIVLEALLEGIPVQIGTVLLEAGEDNIIGIRMTMTNSKTNESQERIYHVDTDLSYFIRKCEAMSDEELFTITSSLGLIRIKREGC